MEQSKQTWGAMIQAQDRKLDRSAVACKDLRTAVCIKIFLIGMLGIASNLVLREFRQAGLSAGVWKSCHSKLINWIGNSDDK
jgi:hypothetical protein